MRLRRGQYRDRRSRRSLIAGARNAAAASPANPVLPPAAVARYSIRPGLDGMARIGLRPPSTPRKRDLSVSDSPHISPDDSRRARLTQLRELGINPYPTRYSRSHRAADIHNQFSDLAAGSGTDTSVTVAGRVSAIRNSGMFVDIGDDSGKLQLYFDLKNLKN